MKLRVIESIIDSIDVFSIAKDIGLRICNRQGNPSLKTLSTDYNNVSIQGNELKLNSSSFLNLDLYKGMFNTFVAGSGIDLLAFYFKDDYEKAFNAFFKFYGSALKSKLVHEPAFIKGILKNSFIKRHHLLNLTIKYLFEDTFLKNINAKLWLDKNNITEESTKGLMFTLSTLELKKYLVYIFNQEFIRIEQIDEKMLSDYSIKKLAPDLDLDNIDYNSWIIIPFFSDYYKISFLKIINPITKEVTYLYLDDTHLAYAGLYSLNKYFNLSNKIRLLEDTVKTAMLISNSKRLLSTEKQYLTIGINENGSSFPTINLAKPIFLYEPNSSFVLLKNLNTLLQNIYICDFSNFTESNTVYKWEDFIFRELKKLVKEDAYLSPRIKALINLVDFSKFNIKRYIANWLKENKYDDIYSVFNTFSNQIIQFKNYSISATNNGYIALIKASNETIVISNFIIRLNNCIIFKDKDDIKVNGVVIMGDNEYPLSFYKKEIAKKDAIENIALKAFANFNILDGAFNESPSLSIKNTLPTIIDKSYTSVLATIINNEISKVPCMFGMENKGWDKANKLYTTPIWRANAHYFKVSPQHFYQSTTSDYCYKNTSIKTTDYKRSGFNFLNKEIKDIIGSLLSYFYRTYFSYNTVPIIVNDTKTARNLLRFIFAALGQREIFEYDVNDRLIKNKKVFQNFNNFPILLKTNNTEQLLKIQNYPFILLSTSGQDISSLYDVTLNLKREDYAKVTRFALDTFERFFNWLFSLKVEEFEPKQDILENQEQLIEEGNQLFDLLWWDEVINACKKSASTVKLFKQFIHMFKASYLERVLKFVPDENYYVLSKNILVNLSKERKEVYHKLKLSDKDHEYFKYSTDGKLYENYLIINKEFFDTHVQNEILLDDRAIDVRNISIFLFDDIVSESIKQKNRSVGPTDYSFTKFTLKDLINKE